MHGLLTAISEELPDVPLHYVLPDMCTTLHCKTPPLKQMKAALLNLGYRVSSQHKEPDAIKTDAPNDIVWDVLRCWVKTHPINKKRETNPKSAGMVILSKEPKIEANFVSIPAHLREVKKACRFPPNPEAFWGPKSRAVGKKRPPQSETVPEEGVEQKTSPEDVSLSPPTKQPRLG
jgi:tRNA (guanine26-N2/guanine27-N2)-dimethyltransferase